MPSTPISKRPPTEVALSILRVLGPMRAEALRELLVSKKSFSPKEAISVIARLRKRKLVEVTRGELSARPKRPD